MIEKELIISLSKEFDKKEGFVTCELSIKRQEIEELESIVKDLSITHGKWIVFECSACVEYYGKHYVHASIERPENIKRIEKSSQHIITL
jgi:hypothetical protein